ncbi:MAG: hypothetical protein KDJ68_13240 [Rhodobiaceae bacterium]|nr:hypothetical protein [Rhodobiaceae bacterium]
MNLVTLPLICRVVCEADGIALSELRSERRKTDVALSRQIVMWLARELTTLSLPRIGRYLSRDHTTVLHGCQKIDRLRHTDPELMERTEAFRLAVEAAALALTAVGRDIPQDIDVEVVARRLIAFPRTVHTLSVDETIALALGVLSAAGTERKLLDQVASQSEALEAFTEATGTYLRAHDLRNAPERRDRIEAGAAILNARKHLEHTLQQWRGHHGNHEDHGEEVECAGSGHAR